METTPVRLALIGLGMATRPHLEVMRDPGSGVMLSGVHSRTPSRAEAVAAKENCRVYPDVRAIAADPDIEGVIVATPPDQRAEIVDVLASAGKHILLEKPIERSLKAAQTLVETCERHGVALGVVLQHRFRPSAIRLAEILASSALGDIGLVRVDVPWWRGQDYYDQPGRGTYARDGGGVLISQAIHVLDLMLSLAGPVRGVQGLCATTRLHSMEAEDFAATGLEFASGAAGSLVATTATFPGAAETITIDGTLGTARLGGGRLEVRWRDGRHEESGEASGSGGGADPMAFPCDWHRDLIADFAAAVRTGRPPRVTGREALNVQALIEAIVASSRTGTRVTLE